MLGSLLHISKYVKPARIFLNLMLYFLRQFVKSNSETIHLTLDFRKDLQWFHTFPQSYRKYDVQPTQHQVYLDTCLTGLGRAYNHLVYALTITRGLNDYDIVYD